MRPLLPITRLARRSKEHFLHIGRVNSEFAYKRIPAHDRTARRVLDSLAIMLGFALTCLLVLLLLFCCHWAYVAAYWTMEDAVGYYRAEVTGVEASDFVSPRDAAPPPPPRFNVTARVMNRHWDTRICLREWQADLWYAGTPLGKAYFPDTCVEKMADESVKASTSPIELIGLPGEIQRHMVASRESSHGGPNLKVEMTLKYMEYKGRYNDSYRLPAVHWLWCDAAVDMQSPPWSCRIRRLFDT